MKFRNSLLLVLLAAAGFALNIWLDKDRLPERVASHFDLKGRPDGWMTRDSATWFMMAVGAGVSLIVAAAFNIARVVPLNCVNLPNREYWFAEERREESLRWLGETGAVCAVLLLLFMSLLHGLVTEANRLSPPHLDPKPLWIAAGALVACVALVVARVMLRFSKRPAE